MSLDGGTLHAMIPQTRYARTTDRTHVAYKVSGAGPTRETWTAYRVTGTEGQP
jgi:hypothetical protein